LVSHNPEEIAKVCTRVIQLKNGKIINDIYLEGTEKQKLSLIEKMAVSEHV
jgi:ABC-2 type transport system ATP-binding protein